MRHLSNRHFSAKIAATLAQRSDGHGFDAIKIRDSGPRLLVQADVERIIERYGNGESLRQLANSLGIHRATIRAHLERNGVARRGPMRTLTDEQCVEIAAQYRTGKSLAQLGEQFSVHAKTVSNELRKLGVEIRPQGKNYRPKRP